MRTIKLADFLYEFTPEVAQNNSEQLFQNFLTQHGKKIVEQYSIKLDDRLVVSTLIRRFRPKTIVETGTNRGGSTVLMALSCNAYIYTLDIADTIPGATQVGIDEFGLAFNDTPLAQRVMKINDSTFNIKPSAVPPADLWFIDSDHSFKTVAHETLLAIENMKENGGLIVYHDARSGLTYESDVNRYLAENHPDAVVVETTCGIGYLLVPPAGANKAAKPKTETAALMMTKNEADIIVPILNDWQKWGVPVFAMDGSTDGTYDILKSYPNVKLFRDSELCAGADMHGSLDWAYQKLLDKKREALGSDNYVCIACGDERWLHDPRKVVADMKKLGSSYAEGESMQFFLHKSDMEKWDFVNSRWKTTAAPHERLRWYSPGWHEARIFYDDGKVQYGDRQGFDTLPAGSRTSLYPRRFVYSHYPLRDPIQVLARAKDRVERAYQPIYQHSYEKDVADTFFEVFPGLTEARRFEGSFGEYESGLEDLL
jgi:predicted O-methyltransferase YrrM